MRKRGIRCFNLYDKSPKHFGNSGRLAPLTRISKRSSRIDIIKGQVFIIRNGLFWLSFLPFVLTSDTPAVCVLFTRGLRYAHTNFMRSNQILLK